LNEALRKDKEKLEKISKQVQAKCEKQKISKVKYKVLLISHSRWAES
jgi:hypothetical protein